MSKPNPYETPQAPLRAESQPPPPPSHEVEPEIAPKLQRAIRYGLMLQIPLGVLTILMLDGGQLLRAFGAAMLCQWAAVFVILLRRARTPGPMDLTIARLGIVPLFAIAVFLQLWLA